VIEVGGGAERRTRLLRTAVLIAAAWMAFGLVDVMVPYALSRRNSEGYFAVLLRLAVVLALTWLALTPVVAGWHKLLRGWRVSGLALIAAHVPLLVLCTIVDTGVVIIFLRVSGRPTPPFFAAALYNADVVAARYVAIAIVTEALLAHRALKARERQAERLAAQLTRARLDYLEAQLQPHFLFNSLGTISELAHDSPHAAVRVLRQLTSLLRFALTAKSEPVTLAEELNAIEPYLEIQRIRFADWLRITEDVKTAALDCLVPPLVLQPLIENAVRHGLAGRVEPGSIAIRASVSRGVLTVSVADNGIGLQAPLSGRGIGLTNLRNRLETLYGAGEHLRLFDAENGGAVAELSIPEQRVGQGQPLSARVAITADDDAGDDIGPGDVQPVMAGAQSHDTLRIAVAWMVCGALWFQQSLAYLAVRNRLTLAAAESSGANDFGSAAWWFALTMLLFATIERKPIAGEHRWFRGAMYLLGSLPIAALHDTLTWWVVPNSGPLISPAAGNMFVVDFLLYWVVVAIGHRRYLTRWLRERELKTQQLRAALADARSRAARLQANPDILLATLERLAAIVPADAARAERVLARLGDYLRLALDDHLERGIAGDRERVLANALKALTMENGAVPAAGFGGVA
jgi:two-component system, LytTR family, sensor kinase